MAATVRHGLAPVAGAAYPVHTAHSTGGTGSDISMARAAVLQNGFLVRRRRRK